MKTFNGSSNEWWERSPCGSYSKHFCFVNSIGDADYIYVSYAFGVAFGFCF